MATTAEQLKRLQRDVETLKKRVAALERGTNSKRRVAKPQQVAPRSRKRALSENERADEILRRAGLLAELTPEEKAMAAEWRALPEEERQRILDEFYNLKLDKPLSEIIIENRR